MTASIPLAVLPADSPLTGLGIGGKTDLKQIGIEGSGGFGKMLGEALSNLSGEVAAESGIAGQADNLLQQLQDLPQGGKLLPLLRRVLDGAAEAGSDAGQVFAQLNASLEQLSASTDLNPLQAIAAALHQVVEANPRYLARGNTVAPVSARQLMGEGMSQQSGDGVARATPATLEQVEPDAGLRALEKLLGPAPQVSATPGQAQAELATALSAVRRLAGGEQAAPDVSIKVDSLASTPVPSTPILAQHATSGTPTVSVGVPLHQANWDQSLGERIQWLVGQGAQGAQIKLNPAHLGPMEVRIQMQNDQATIQFTATHAVVREALEAALPRLREMLGDSGVELVNVDVSGESFAEQQRAGADSRATSGAVAGGEVDDEGRQETVIETPVISPFETGRLDLFA